MKKITSIILGLSIFLMLTACNNNLQEAPSAASTPVDEPPNAEAITNEAVNNVQIMGANIQIAFATDELPRMYENFHEFIHVEDAGYMIVWTDTPVTDFEFIWISNSFDLVDWDVDEDTQLYFFVEDVIYSVGELTPEIPFKVRTWGDWGHMPRIGVSFTDTNDAKRYFHIQQSMMDGELNITEFENKAY